MAELRTETDRTPATSSSCAATETQSSCCTPAESSDGYRGQSAELTREPAATAADRGRQVQLFEPAMCCETGVCGPAVDRQLIDVREDLRWIEGRGARVSRHNLSSDPDAFIASSKVTGLIAAFGERALPALLIDGEIAVHGRYPSRDELGRLLELAPASRPPTEPAERSTQGEQSTDCGCGPGGCG